MFAAKNTAAPSGEAVYIESVFSTYLYTGNGSTQTITNNIDLSTKGGLVWIKQRSVANAHALYDTARGVRKAISSNFTLAELTAAAGKELTAFNTTGFSLGTDDNYTVNANATTFVSWTFRKQAKFFDVVTYTGNGTYPRNISHNLGSTPGCIIVKKLSATSDWFVYHRSLSVDGTFGPYRILLNTTAAQSVNDDWKNAPTSTQFTVNNSDTNGNGVTYVAYLFAHDAGGFGATGSDNVISCGSFTSNTAETVTVNLGYEPQFVIVKRSDAVGDWYVLDTMRGWDNSSSDAILYPNYSNAEGSAQRGEPNATGFRFTEGAVARTYIYIAIRRGPMKTPTSGTSVFAPITATGNGSSNTLTTNFPVDLSIDQSRVGAGGAYFIDRLRGGTQYFSSDSSAAESTYPSNLINFASNTSIVDANYGSLTSSYVDWAFRRAPGFFDVACYTTTSSSNQRITHNLTVVPELIITKSRSNVSSWFVYVSSLGRAGYLNLYLTNAAGSIADSWGATNPTTTDFGFNNNVLSNGSVGRTYVAYLFATLAGVSKVGSYTGTGALQTINCGFAAGARFVLIKRTDSTGDWWVYDSARGITSGNDPYLFLNSTAAEVTNTNYVDTASTGFQVTAAAPAGLNANGGTYIFLAIS